MALENLLGGLATDAKLEALRVLLASAASEAKLEAVRVLLAGAASEAKLEAVRALLAGTLTVTSAGAAAATSAAVGGTVTPSSYTPNGGSPQAGGAPNFTIGPFTPQMTREIWLQLVGTAASGTAQLMRSIDAGATKVGLTAGGLVWASYAFTGVTGPICHEQVAKETQAGATYYLAVTLTAGSVKYSISQ